MASMQIVSSTLTRNLILANTGRIATERTKISDASEIRGIFIHSSNTLYPDWNLIAQTAVQYGINTIVVEAMGNSWGRYPSDVISHWDYDLLTPGLQASRSNGLKFYVAMNVLAEGKPDNLSLTTIRASTMAYGDAMCPTNPGSRDRLRAIVEELVRRWDIDGFMFDYMRYTWGDECACPYCKAKFIADTGLSNVNWPTDIKDGGRYQAQFMNWHTVPVNELVRDMKDWMLAINPNLEFAAATWRWPPEAPNYWRYWIGQDSTYWVKEGWLDWVAPMFYTDDVNELTVGAQSYVDLQTGGPEGKIPVAPFIDTVVDTVSTPENFKQRVAAIRQLGGDGYVIWRYGGPGDGQGSSSPDIRPYLDGINQNQTFLLRSIAVSTFSDRATISWVTDKPATTKVEYSTSPIFDATFRSSYWEVDHIVGTVVENATLEIAHNLTLTGLLSGQTYYFRVQSKDGSGIATSKVLTFRL